MLRRTKALRAYTLPACSIHLTPCPFEPEEQAVYDAMEKHLGGKVQGIIKTKMNCDVPSVLEVILRLRQGKYSLGL